MIKKVTKAPDILSIEKLAFKIWNSHYTPIIGQQQVDYMLEKFQNFEAISSQLKDGYEYYLLSNENKAIGYLGLLPDATANKLMISKIYIDPTKKNNGYGTQLINFTKKLAKTKHLNLIWLTVNKNNANTIKWYKKLGFTVDKEITMDIGNDFVMDDFVMELHLD